jgi:hypothetical protein
MRYRRWFREGLVKAAEETAQELSSGLDNRALLWTFRSLDEDHELERFFAAIPGFCDSKVLIDPPVAGFVKAHDRKLSAALINFMDRTLSSYLGSLFAEWPLMRRSLPLGKSWTACFWGRGIENCTPSSSVFLQC